MKKEINLKGLGTKQTTFLNRMINENLKIVIVKDAYENKQEIDLRTEDDDLLENLDFRFVNSLGRRFLFEVSHWMPSIRMEFTTLKLKKSVTRKLMP